MLRVLASFQELSWPCIPIVGASVEGVIELRLADLHLENIEALGGKLYEDFEITLIATAGTGELRKASRDYAISSWILAMGTYPRENSEARRWLSEVYAYFLDDEIQICQKEKSCLLLAIQRAVDYITQDFYKIEQQP